MTCLGLGSKTNPHAGHVRVDLSDMASPETWTKITGIYEIVLEWSAEESSSEVYITVANHPAILTFNPFQRIRLVRPLIVDIDGTVTPEQIFFIGRINKVDPTFKGAMAMAGAQGYALTIYARDYMQAPADNFVQADVMHDTYAFKAAAGASYVPIYADEAEDETPAGQPRSPRLAIIQDLITRTGIIPDVTPQVTAPIATLGDFVSRNYMDTPQTTVLSAIRALAEEQPWDEESPPSGTGYTFRVAPPGLMGDGAVFQYFQRGQLEWDVTQDFGWQPDPGDDSKYPILTFRATHEGQSIYSRSRVLGKGLSSYTAPSVSVPSMETTWNPAEGLFKVTREATTNDEVLTQLIELQQRARKAVTTGAGGTADSFRGAKIGTITVMGIPLNANLVSPIPGDTIHLDPVPPGLENPTDNNKYVISRWKFTWPEGTSTYTLNRRAKARSVSLNQTLMQRGLAILSSMKDIYDSGWLVFDVTGQGTDIVPPDRRYKHNKGVIPRHVFVYAADADDVDASLSTDPNDIESAILLMPSMYDPLQNMFIGYQITAATPQYVQVSFYPFLGFSQGAVDGGHREAGTAWLKQNISTKIRVFIQP
ncbi:hypothetical protein LCGC14_2173030 [marine sediment metagenome]|uniref:Uncharacterized protein n=1 Tax=marine sediment metagenome TaxID=412755 RepID=A0A0F9DPJ7_9ZZZZ